MLWLIAFADLSTFLSYQLKSTLVVCCYQNYRLMWKEKSWQRKKV